MSELLVVFLYLNLRSSEIHLFYNLGDFYWHFLEILWLFIFLVFYKLSMEVSQRIMTTLMFIGDLHERKKNYNSKREDLEEEDQRQDERNVIL